MHELTYMRKTLFSTISTSSAETMLKREYLTSVKNQIYVHNNCNIRLMV